MLLRFIGLIFILTCFYKPVNAQFYNGIQSEFGKNRVQYNKFLWSFYKFNNYEVYFHIGGQEIAQYVSKVASNHIAFVENKFDSKISSKIQFIVFNNLNDLKQSNLGLETFEELNIGGNTQILGNKVFLYFNGDHNDLERQILLGITRLKLNELLYGTDVIDFVKSSHLTSYPEWFTEGLISYIANDWTPEIDNYVKDGILNGNFSKLNILKGNDAKYAGHSVFKYIETVYDKDIIKNIIYFSRITQNIENSFVYIIGLNYKKLIFNWLEFYDKTYFLNNEKSEKPNGEPITKFKNDVYLGQVKSNFNNKNIAYVVNNQGRYKVFIVDTKSNKKHCIIRAGYRFEDYPDYSYPLLAWNPDGKILAIVRYKKGKFLLHRYNIKDKKLITNELFYIDNVQSFSFSKDGLSLIMSCVQNGRSDIFIYHFSGNAFDKITNDIYDDKDPVFIDNDKYIIFSSNRENDTLGLPATKNSLFKSKYDLFIYDLKNYDNILRRITNTENIDEFCPKPYDNSYFYFLSNENGVNNRFLAKIDSSISFVDTTIHYNYFAHKFPITNYSRNIIDYEINTENNICYQTFYFDRKFKCFKDSLTTPSEQKPISLTQPYVFKEPIIAKPKDKDSVAFIDENKDEGKERLSVVYYESYDVFADNTTIIGSDSINSIDSTAINENDSTLSIAEIDSSKLQFILPTQRVYETTYYPNKIVTQLENNYLWSSYQSFTGGGGDFFNLGMNGLFKLGVADLFEDYRIVGGVRLAGNLKGNEYLLYFEDLKKRLDKRFVFHKQTFNNTYQDYLYRVFLHEFSFQTKWALDRVISFRGTLTYRNDRTVFTSSDIYSLITPNLLENWVGATVQFVYDNSKNISTNIYNGTRYKLFFEYNRQLDLANTSFYNFGFDYRNYKKIYREFIFANRLAGGHSLGDKKLIYYMGSVDNWLNLGKTPTFNNNIPIDYSQNYAFQTLITNLRGFSQNVRNGNSFMVLNSELRLPLLLVFSNKPISSSFFNNFQVIAFGDFGSSWNGISPFDEKNKQYREVVVQGPPLKVTRITPMSTFVAGYGFGLRSKLFGYFVRADLAWGVADGVKYKPVFYLSFSLDF